MKHTLGKEERLKSKKLIEKLYAEGNSVKAFPLRMMYLKTQHTSDYPAQVGVSVPKRNFKLAVDRNRIKRLMRETYRLQKEIVYNENNKEIPLDKSTIVSMNFWGFTPKIFSEIEHQFYTFLEKNSNNNEAEFYLPSVVNNLLESKKATVNVIKTNAIWMGVTYKNDKEKVVLGIKKMKEEGNYPQKLWS